MIVLILLANLFISFFNARSAGTVWAEAKAVGGWVRILVWCGAIQSAVGFTFIYAYLAAMIAISTGYLDQQAAEVFASLIYVMIIVPAIGTGIVITLQSWIALAREQSLANLGTAAWNTYASAHNIYHAVQGFGGAFDKVASGLGGLFEDNRRDKKDSSGIVILLAVIVVLAGILTTATIIKRYAGTLPMPRRRIDEARA